MHPVAAVPPAQRRTSPPTRCRSFPAALLLEPLEPRQLLSAPVKPSALLPATRETISPTRVVVVAPSTPAALTTPTDFTPQDIGSPGRPGSFAYSDGVYTLSGGGSDIGGAADHFHFTSIPLPGDSVVTARVTSLTNTDPNAKAGVMLRADASPTAAFAGLFLTPSGTVTFITRAAGGDTAGQTASLSVIPRFLRLVRTGDSVTASQSADGVTWTQVGSPRTVALGGNTLAGMAVTARNDALLATATFTSFAALPAGWALADVGNPTRRATALYDPADNSFSLASGGAGIGGASDQFAFAGRTMLGDGSLLARVDLPNGAGPDGKAGIMIRDGSAADARFASLTLTPVGSIVFQWRSTPGAAAGSTTVPNPTGRLWFKLVQSAGSVSAYYSADQVTWNQLGSAQSFPATSATTLAGLVATTSQTTMASATFYGASVLQSPWDAADVGSTSLVGSAAYDPPGNTYTLAGSGADICGTSDQFQFLARPMTGDGTVSAYINARTNTHPWAKAGLMLRADRSAASPFVGVFVSPTNGIVFEWRTSAGAPVQQSISVPAGGLVPTPVGLKLTRTGNAFAASYSTDGVTWLPVAPSQSVALPSTSLAGAALTSHDNSKIVTATFTGLYAGPKPPPGSGVYSTSDELFLADLTSRSVQFFLQETNPATGLVPDGARASGGSPSAFASIAAVGFGLSALTIADARGLTSHADAYQRTLNTLKFLYNNAAQVNGFFYHFLNPTTGARYGNSELSTIDTALLMAGVLNAAQHWPGTEIPTVAQSLYNRVNWPWMQRPDGVFYGAWTPESGFSAGYGDFSEAALLYLLALGSPTHPTAQSSWLAWSRTPVVHYGSYTFVTAQQAALFTVQYPQAWFDLRGLTDPTGLDFYANAQSATLAQRQWSIDSLSQTFPTYGPNLWGLTASDGPNGYTVWGGPPASGPIDGTVVPTAPGGSLAFTPRRSLDALLNMRQTYGNRVYQKYGFVDAFNPANTWTSPLVLGIDLGMMLLAAENSRSNLIWDAFNANPAVKQATAEAFPTPAKSVWSRNASGDWNAPSSWANSTVPNSATANAELAGAQTTPRTVFTDTPVTLASLRLDSPGPYTLAGAGSLTLQSNAGPARITVPQGTHRINLPLTLASNTVFDVAPGATLVIADPMTINPNLTLTQTGGGTVTYQSPITLLPGASIITNASAPAPSPTLTPVPNTQRLTIAVPIRQTITMPTKTPTPTVRTILRLTPITRAPITTILTAV